MFFAILNDTVIKTTHWGSIWCVLLRNWTTTSPPKGSLQFRTLVLDCSKIYFLCYAQRRQKNEKSENSEKVSLI